MSKISPQNPFKISFPTPQKKSILATKHRSSIKKKSHQNNNKKVSGKQATTKIKSVAVNEEMKSCRNEIISILLCLLFFRHRYCCFFFCNEIQQREKLKVEISRLRLSQAKNQRNVHKNALNSTCFKLEKIVNQFFFCSSVVLAVEFNYNTIAAAFF